MPSQANEKERRKTGIVVIIYLCTLRKISGCVAKKVLWVRFPDVLLTSDDFA